jgi:hypothetical protein
MKTTYAPWCKNVSPEEQLKIRQRVDKVKSFCINMRKIARILSIIFLIWLSLGLLGIEAIFDFSLKSIVILSYFFTMPHGLYVAGVRDNLLRLEKIESTDDEMKLHRKMMTEGQVFLFYQGGIAVVATFLQFQKIS